MGQRTLDGHDTVSSVNQMYLDQSQTQPESTEIVTVGTENNPRGPFPSGIEVAVDASPSGAGSPQNRCATDIPDGFPEGTSHSGTPRGSGGSGNPGPMDIDTDDRSSTNRTPATQGSADQSALMVTQPLVAMATSLDQTRAPASGTHQGPQAMCSHLAAASDTRQGSQTTCQSSDSSQRAGVTGGVSTQAMKTPPVVNIVSLSGNTAVSSSTSTSVSTMQSESSMALPATGMDMQWRDPRAQNDPLSSGLPQMWQTISTSCNLRSFYPWVSKIFLWHRCRHHNRLFNSQQHRLRLRVSRPRMLSWWHRPCGR